MLANIIIHQIVSEQQLSDKFLKTVIEGAWMMKSGKLFQKSTILTEKKLALARLIACSLKSLQEWPLVKVTYDVVK